jgi:anti-anti-sigma factor
MDGSLFQPASWRDRVPVTPGEPPGVIALSGDLDATTRESVRATLAAAVAQQGLGSPEVPEEIVVDLRAVRFLDAGTVRLLLEAWRTANDAGRRLCVTGAYGPVRQVIEASGAGHRLLDSATVPAPRAGPVDGTTNWLRAVTERRRVVDDQTRIVAVIQQRAIDREVRATRHQLLGWVRARLHDDPQAVSSEEFLAVADTLVVLDAILVAASVVGAADACDLHQYDAGTGALHLIRQFGLTAQYLTYFATVSRGQSSACATAVLTGEPVIVDDVKRSPIFAGQPSRDVMLAAGSRAVQSYPLRHDDGRLLAVLSLHYGKTRPRGGNPELVAWSAARALTRMPSPSIGAPVVALPDRYFRNNGDDQDVRYA